MGLIVVAVRGMRRSRTGRAIIAMRENERAAQSYSISPTRVTLTAFVISGAIAGIAGGLFVHLSQSFDLSSYGADDSITVFIAGVVGGLGSITGAVLGAIYLKGGEWFITNADWRVLTSGAGVLLVLLILPGGLGGLVNTLREKYVRWCVERDAGRRAAIAAETLDATADRRRSHRPRRCRRGGGARVSDPWPRRLAHGVRHPMLWLRDVCGGEAAFPLVVLFGLNAVDELDRAAFGILLPEIRDHFDVDLQTVLGLVALAAVGHSRSRCRSPSTPIAPRAHAWRSSGRWCGRCSRDSRAWPPG
jgi:hypothetical protein